MDPILTGCLGTFSAERVLRLIAATGIQSRLVVTTGSRQVVLWLSDSRICFADRGDPAAFRRLLAERGAGSRLIDRLPPGSEPHHEGFISGASAELPLEMLVEWSRWHTEEALMDLLLLNDGRFELFAVPSMPADAVESALELTSSLDALLQRLHLERLVTDSTIFRAGVPSGDGRYHLTATELRILVAADGRRTFAALAEDEGFDSSAGAAALGLWRRGLLQPAEGETASTAGQPEAATPASATPAPASEPPSPPASEPQPLPAAAATATSTAEGTVMDLPLSSLRAPDLSDSGVMLMACLTLEDEARTSHPLFEEACTIGREARNQIQIPDKSVSSRHARISRTSEGYELEDLGSRNGTFVNGEQIQKQIIKDQDMLRFGTVYATFSLPSRLKPAAATMFGIPNPSND